MSSRFSLLLERLRVNSCPPNTLPWQPQRTVFAQYDQYNKCNNSPLGQSARYVIVLWYRCEWSYSGMLQECYIPRVSSVLLLAELGCCRYCTEYETCLSWYDRECPPVHPSVRQIGFSLSPPSPPTKIATMTKLMRIFGFLKEVDGGKKAHSPILTFLPRLWSHKKPSTQTKRMLV